MLVFFSPCLVDDVWFSIFIFILISLVRGFFCIGCLVAPLGIGMFLAVLALLWCLDSVINCLWYCCSIIALMSLTQEFVSFLPSGEIATTIYTCLDVRSKHHLLFLWLILVPQFPSNMASPNSQAFSCAPGQSFGVSRNLFPRPRANESHISVNVGDTRITVDQRDTHVTIKKPSSSYVDHYTRFCLVGRIFGKKLDADTVLEKAA